MPREGVLIQLDGSYHRWLGKDGPQFTLQLRWMMPRAPWSTLCLRTGEHPAVTTSCCSTGLIRRRGMPLALYVDRHAVFKHTPSQETAAAPTSSVELWTSWHTADLRSITQARIGWSVPRERSRAGLVAELRLSGATTIDDANPRAGGLPATLQQPLQDASPEVGSRLSRSGPEGCVWIGSCASSTGAESPGTTRSDTAGAPISVCPCGQAELRRSSYGCA